MQKITNMQEATQALYEEINKINPDIKEEDVYEIILDEVLESIEDQLSDKEIQDLETNNKTPEDLEKYLQKKIPNFQTLLKKIVEDMISEEE